MAKNAASAVQIVLDEVNNSCLILQRDTTPAVTLLRLTMLLCLASSFINRSHDLQESSEICARDCIKNQTYKKRSISELKLKVILGASTRRVNSERQER